MKNQFVQMIINLQKAGISVYLTDAGMAQILKMLKDEIAEINNEEAEAV